MRRILVAVSSSVLLLAGCSTDSGPTPTAPESTQAGSATSSPSNSQAAGAPGQTKKEGDRADGVPGQPSKLKCESLSKATDRQLAGRLMAVGVTDFASAQQAVDAGVRHLFIGTGSDYSMFNGQGDPRKSIAALEKRAGEKLTISVDEEGGEVQRLSGIVGELPSARKMANTMSPEQVRKMMAEHGRKLRNLGVTVDFAPVLDLGGAEDISANGIGSRAFSADPRIVAKYGRAYAEGLRDAGITPVFKHFPGHGHVKGDSHLGTVVAPPLDVMQKQDLVPFKQLAAMGGDLERKGGRPASMEGNLERPAAAMMVGHMQVPGLGAKMPSSINPAAYKLLRDANFDGLIVTDDLTGMKAVSEQMSGPEAVVAAVSAGANQALAAAGGIDVPAAVDGLTRAISSGKIPRERAIASADRGCLPA